MLKTEPVQHGGDGSPTPQAVTGAEQGHGADYEPSVGGETGTLEPASTSSRHGPRQKAGSGPAGAEDVAGGHV